MKCLLVSIFLTFFGVRVIEEQNLEELSTTHTTNLKNLDCNCALGSEFNRKISENIKSTIRILDLIQKNSEYAYLGLDELENKINFIFLWDQYVFSGASLSNVEMLEQANF